MKIITKTVTRSDLFDIIFGLDTVSLDLTLLNEFSKKDEPTVSIIEIEEELSKLPIQLPTLNLENIQEFEIQFTRAYHLYLLLTMLKKKNEIRARLPEFLILMLNKKIRCSNYFSKPYSILYSFYGENAVSAMIDTVSALPGITAKEKEFLVPYLENAHYFALSTINLFRVQNVIALSEVSFALFCEQNAIKSDFLQVKYEKRANNKFVSPTANNVINLLAGTKFSKINPKNIITTWVDLVAQVKTVVLESLNSILEEVNVEENENLKELNIKDDNYNAKNVLFFNTQSLNLATSISAVIQNAFERIKEVKQIEKDFSLQIESLSAEFIQKRIELFTMLNASSHEKPIGFGTDFGSMLYIQNLANILYEYVLIESVNSFNTLELLNKEMIEKASKGKGTEESKENKEKKVSRKIQLGRGTLQLFAKFDDEIFSKVVNAPLDANVLPLFRDFFDPFNVTLLDFLAEIVSPKNNERRKPKIPKGTRDMEPLQMTIRRMAINTISNIFRKHGAVEIDTPVFELRETLTGKYGEDSKLIYDLNDQGGEQLSLRYDLTVPFARYLALKGATNMKRLHIAKVYRRDQPQPKKGRFREFYQCDYDIVGSYGVMIPDAECLMILNEIFTTLSIGKVIIKVNHRKLLNAMVELSGAPKQKFKTICSSIDKLDKEPWENVKKELVTEKGLTEDMANKLGEFVKFQGNPMELFEKLSQAGTFKDSKEGDAALKEMGILFKYLEDAKSTENILFDLSLARGLDYYTGIIYEAVLGDNTIGLGSIAGGGRYDELVGMFSNKDLPAVGLSIGIERVFGLLEKKYENNFSIRECETEVLVGSIGSGQTGERFKLCKLLWDNDIKAEMLYNENPKPQKQLQYALENYVPFVLWIGEEELKNNKVKIKCLYKTQEEEVSRDELVAKLKQSLGVYSSDLANGLIEFKKVEDKKEEKKEDKEEKGKGRERGGEKGKGSDKAKGGEKAKEKADK